MEAAARCWSSSSAGTRSPIINDTYIADEHRCAVEFEVDHPNRGIVPIVDVFTIDASGQITRLAVYRR